MCVLLEKYTKALSVTGYKVAYLKGNKIISLATGSVYEPGKVHKKIKCDKPTKCFTDDILDPKCGLYKKNMVGKTSMFYSINDAKDFYRHLLYGFDDVIPKKQTERIIIIKMTLSGNLYSGIYYSSRAYQIVAGDFITLIERVNMEEIINV